MGLRSPTEVWKKDEIAALIALFETERSLYAESDNDSENKLEAYKRIFKIMLRIRPDCTIDEIIHKIKNFKKQYISEVIHRDDSVKSGLCTKETYKPRVWYFDLLQFLEDYSSIEDFADGKESPDAFEESDDNEDVEENVVRKKRKVESSSSEREVLNTLSSVKKHGSTSEKKSHRNSSSVRKVHNTSVSQKKKQNGSSSEKKIHNSSNRKKMNNTEKEQKNSPSLEELLPKNSSLSEKERKNSLSSERELKSSSSSEKELNFSDLESKKEFYKVPPPLDIPNSVHALNALDREDIFGQYVASELRTLRNNPLLYLQTKQSILESITSANFELLNPDS